MSSSSGEVTPAAPRTLSVDVLRALTILLMVLVNDAQRAVRAPAWLKHMPRGLEGMTAADVVVPGFLFVMGMSVPLALSRARSVPGARRAKRRDIVWRTLGLLTMGVLMVGRHHNVTWAPGYWIGAMYLSFLATFCVIPKQPGPRRTAFRVARLLGIASLCLLALVYRERDTGERLVLGPLFMEGSQTWLLHRWWGILGQIGWAYLTTAVIFLLVGPRSLALCAAVAAGIGLFALGDAGIFSADASAWSPLARGAYAPLAWLHSHVHLGRTIGISGAIALAGCVIGARIGSERPPLPWALGVAAASALAALALTPIYGVSKHTSSPSWALWSCAISALAWVLLHLLLDGNADGNANGNHRDHARSAWVRALKPAAENPLLAYFLHPVVRGVIALVPGLHVLEKYKLSGAPPIIAVLGALAMTGLVLFLTGVVSRLGLRVRV